MRSGRLLARFGSLGVASIIATIWTAGCDMPADPTESVRIVAITATEATVTVGTDLTPAPLVRAIDGGGGPVSGIVVSFQLESGGGNIANTSFETDGQGLATVGRWTLDRVAGSYTLTARASGARDVVFTVRALAGPPATVTSLSGDHQVAPVGERLQEPLRVRLSDSFDNPIPDARVSFVVSSGNGSLERSSAVTDAEGTAGPGRWTLGPAGGVQEVRAQSGPAQVVFSAIGFTPPAGLQGRLAFVSHRDGNAEIYVMTPDGGDLRRLTSNGAINGSPAWSPDGRRVAFVSGQGRDWDVFTMAPDGSDVIRRTRGVGVTDGLTWSPDGSTLAFAAVIDGSSQIAMVGEGDPTPVVLADTPGYDGQPSWSPDAQQLAFVSDRDAYDIVFNIYTMSADGTGQTLRTPGFGFWPDIPHYLHPTWSPDGSMIAFVYGTVIDTQYMRFKVALMTPGGAFIRDLAFAGDIPWAGLLDPGSLTWSPDGRGIAFTFVACGLASEGRSCTAGRSVRYVSLDGSQRGLLVAHAESPSWTR